MLIEQDGITTTARPSLTIYATVSTETVVIPMVSSIVVVPILVTITILVLRQEKTRGQWPYRLASNRALKMASDLKPATSFTLESICTLLLRAAFMASEALEASK